ncbi:MAG TPA: hypothetical protein VK511_09200 [Gemmatimonadaceae bacterium]|nr:hypothetical protein [Gemmatimonadaceae bacterium]
MTRNPKKQPKSTTRTHAGAESAEGIKAVAGQRGGESKRSAKSAARSPAKPAGDKMQHPGSEPLEERTMEHESGYGGKGGEPRVSADQRESTNADGSLRAESNKR